MIPHKTACNGYLEIVKWSVEHKVPSYRTLWYLAAEYGHLDLLKFLYQTDPEWSWDIRTCRSCSSRWSFNDIKMGTKKMDLHGMLIFVVVLHNLVI